MVEVEVGGMAAEHFVHLYLFIALEFPLLTTWLAFFGFGLAV